MSNNVAIIAKIFVCLMGMAVLAVLIVLLPELAREEAVENPDAAQSTTPYLIGAWALSTPIFIALYQTLKLVGYVAREEALSDRSVRALKTIKNCATLFGLLIVVGGIATIVVAKSSNPAEDVTPIIVFGIIFTFVASVVATSAAVLQQLVQSAMDIKSENDLTV